MRRFALLIALAATQADAQAPPLTPDQEAALNGLPVVVAGVGSLALFSLGESPVQYLLLALPLAAGATACGAGRLTGAAGSCRGALMGGALGALPGLAPVGAGYALGWRAEDILLDDGWMAFGLVLIGAVAYVVVPPFTAAHGYRRGARVEPAALRAPNGTVATGSALRVRL